MRDIVERLREPAYDEYESMEEAADEIERLRGLLREFVVAFDESDCAESFADRVFQYGSTDDLISRSNEAIDRVPLGD